MVLGVLLTGYYVFVMCEAHRNSYQLKAPVCGAQSVRDLLMLGNAACGDYTLPKIHHSVLVTIKLHNAKLHEILKTL